MSIKIRQQDITDCGAACLASVAAHFKLQLPISRIRQLAHTDQKGTNVLGMIKAAEKMGFSAKGVKGPMDSLSEIPLPTIAHIVVKKVLHHFVVIYKVTKDQVIVMDPALGKLTKYRFNEWEKIWTGVLILIAPCENFKAGNEKVSVISRLLFLVKPHKSVLIQALFGAIIYTVLGLSISIYIQKITDFVIPDGNKNLLNMLSIGMLIILGLQITINVLKSIFVIRTGQKIDAHLILGYYHYLLKLPQQFFDTMRIGEIISRINDAVKIRTFINDVAMMIVVNLFIILFSFALMFTYYWKLALFMVVIIPVYILIYWLTNKLNRKTERNVMERSAELESQLVESLTNIRTIKEFGLETYEGQKTEIRFIRLLESVYQSAMNSIFTGTSAEITNRIFVVILLWSGSHFVISQIITPGELLSFYALIGYFTGPIGSLVGMNKTIQNALIASDRLFEIMDLKTESQEDLIDITTDKLGDITFENISFSYGSRTPVFTHLNLTFPSGKITAVVGESGSGKSTLFALLQKLYQPTSGQILIGSYNLKYVSTPSLRCIAACVPQKLELFSGSVIDNIAVGCYTPDMARIMSICALLDIRSFIEALPQGFHTFLGERGLQLSGGQQQRLAIARALYRDPEIILLDEATSSLDSKSEMSILLTLDKLKTFGKTIIVVAHRLSTIKGADHILVLDQGELVEKGTHKSLLKEGGKYASLWYMQTGKIKKISIRKQTESVTPLN